MANVTKYQVMFYGSKGGYNGNRAQIQLMEGETVLGWIRFHDAGMPFPDDEQSGDKLIMHLPAAMVAAVVDILRNERPLNYYFASGRAFLATTAEVVGELDRG